MILNEFFSHPVKLTLRVTPFMKSLQGSKNFMERDQTERKSILKSLKALIKRTKIFFGLGLKSIDYFGGSILCDDPHLFDSGESSLMDTTIRNIVKEGMIFIDVGTHVGYYALIAAKLVGPSGRVYAFEPNPYNFQILKKNVSRNNYTNVTTVNKAVSDTNGFTNFTIAESSDSGSLFEDVVKKKLENVKVSVVSLDGFFENVSSSNAPIILKIDAEGADALVVNGAIRTIARSQKIVLEVNPKSLKKSGSDPFEMLSWLKNMGYSVRVIDVKSRRENIGHELESIESIVRSLENEGFANVLAEK